MKETEDISARAEERYPDVDGRNLLFQQELKNRRLAFIEGYKARLAAQYHISEERIEDIIDELDNKLIRWSTEESSEWSAWRIGVRDGLLAAQSQSVGESNADIINKLGPIRNLIHLMEFKEKYPYNAIDSTNEQIKSEIEQCKVSIEYLSNLKLSEERMSTKQEIIELINLHSYIDNDFETVVNANDIIEIFESLPSAPIKKNGI